MDQDGANELIQCKDAVVKHLRIPWRDLDKPSRQYIMDACKAEELGAWAIACEVARLRLNQEPRPYQQPPPLDGWFKHVRDCMTACGAVPPPSPALMEMIWSGYLSRPKLEPDEVARVWVKRCQGPP